MNNQIIKHINKLTTLCLIFMIAFSGTVSADTEVSLIYNGEVHIYQNTNITITVNDKEVDISNMFPIIIDGRTYVPMRDVLENPLVGAEVLWDSPEKKALIDDGSNQIEVWVDRPEATVNGEVVTLDAPPKLIAFEGSEYANVMVPLRFLGEAMGYDVSWDGERQQVKLKKGIELVAGKATDDAGPEEGPILIEDPSDQNEVAEKDEVAVRSEVTLADLAHSPTAIRLNQKDASLAYEDLDSSEKHDRVKLTNVLYYEYHDHYKVITNGPMSSVTSFVWEGKLIIDIENADIGAMEKEIDVYKNQYVTNVRSSQFSLDPMTSRVVFDLVEGARPSAVILNEDRTMIDVVFGGDGLDEIEIGCLDDYDYIDIKGGIDNINVFSLTEPHRLIIDLENTINPFGYNDYEGFKSDRLEEIRIAQFNERTTRIVVESDDVLHYELIELEDYTRVVLGNEGESIETYASRKTFDTVAVAVGSVDELGNYNIEYDYIGKKAVIAFDEDVHDILELFAEENQTVFEEINVKGNKLYLTSDHIYEYDLEVKDGALNIRGTRPDERYDAIVVIDAGHGGDLPGAVYNGVLEKDLNLAINRYMQELVSEDSEIKYYFTRTTDIDVPFSDRCELANDLNADLFVSLHNNAMDVEKYPHQIEINGLEVQVTSGREQSAAEEALGQCLLDGVDGINGLNPRGIKVRNGLFVLNNTYMTSVLIEYGYMTNPGDFDFLTKDENLENLAEMTVECINEYLNKQ